jgi:hypothetical protein
MPSTTTTTPAPRLLSGLGATIAALLSLIVLASTSSTAEAASRNGSLYPFASSSPWNTAIGSSAKFEPSWGARTKSLMTVKPVINSSVWSTPVYRATTSDVYATLKSVRTGQSWKIRIPSHAKGAAGTGGYSDGHATIIQPDGKTAYDAFKLVKRSTTLWEAQVAKVVSVTGSGTHMGVRAAGTPGMAGLIRTHELRDKRINHALAMAVPNTILKSGYVWPAKSQDTDGYKAYSGQVPMGSLFAIPGSVNLSSLGLSAEGMALGKALQNYGTYVVDRSGMVTLYCESNCDSTATYRMRTDWKKLQTYLRAVTNNTSSTVGGGGTPRVPALAPVY